MGAPIDKTDKKPDKLHRVHAVPAQGGSSFDIEAVRWRGEGGTFEERRAQAFRLALAWNLLEGVPTKAAANGAVRDFYEAVSVLLVELERDRAYTAAVARVRGPRRPRDRSHERAPPRLPELPPPIRRRRRRH